MGFDLSRFRVVYSEKVYRCVAVIEMRFKISEDDEYKAIKAPERMKVIVLNEDNNIIEIEDEAWTFQFIPIAEG